MTGNSSFDQKNQSVKTQTNIKHADKVIIQPSDSVLPLPQQIPSPPFDFKGREEEIKSLLDQFDQGATITGLRGMGGIGKTALALVLADRLKDSFPDGQLFLNMLGTSKIPLKPEDAMAHVIRSYRGVDDPLPEDQNGLSGLYQSILSGKKALILLDNAADREQVEPLLPPKGCALLVTSRNKFALPGLKEKDLDVLPLEEAKNLLLDIAGRIGGHAEELAELCGRLPIALRNAAYALKEKPNISMADYMKRLGDARIRLELVDASFTSSYNLLTQNLQRLWCLLSVFPADFDLAGAAAVWDMEQIPAEDALGELVKWSLVDFLPSATSEGGRVKLHDLARDFADSRLETDAREFAQQRHAKHYQEFLLKANDLFLQGGESLSTGLDRFDTDWTNIQIGQEWAKINMTKSLEIAEICSNFAWAGNILNLRLDPLKNIRWQEAALIAVRKTKNQKAKCAHMGNLGIAYAALGDAHKAIEYYEQALKISREIGDKRSEGNGLGNLGSAYYHLGETRKAIEYYEQALKISCEIGDQQDEGNHLGNLGLAYSHLGETRKAIEYYEQGLKIVREIEDTPGEGAHLCNLGFAYSDLGETRKAIEYYEQGLKIAREIGDRMVEANGLDGLGNAYSHLGKMHKAIECHEQALKISHEIGDRQGEGYRLGNLGLAYFRLAEPVKAIEYYELALKIACEIGDRRSEGNHSGNLGNAYSDLGEPRKAIENYEQALKISREIGDRQGEGNHSGNLGNAYSDLGDPKKAIEYYEQALKISREVGDRRGEGNRLGNLGLAYSDLGEPKKAIEYYEQALKISREIGDRRGEGNDLGNLGNAYSHLGEPKKAIEYYEHALQISREIGDPRGEGILLFNISLYLESSGQRENAVDLAKSALAIFEQMESPYAETVRNALAQWKS
jgi:tetratricopeptide (TPR) repeat protein